MSFFFSFIVTNLKNSLTHLHTRAKKHSAAYTLCHSRSHKHILAHIYTPKKKNTHTHSDILATFDKTIDNDRKVFYPENFCTVFFFFFLFLSLLYEECITFDRQCECNE